MRASWTLLLLVSLVSTGAAWAESKAAKPPPPTVLVAPVEVKDVSPVYTNIGVVQAIQSVQIVPRVTAFIEEEPTPQGSEVKMGQPLFLPQKTQYAAALLSAQAHRRARRRLFAHPRQSGQTEHAGADSRSPHARGAGACQIGARQIICGRDMPRHLVPGQARPSPEGLPQHLGIDGLRPLQYSSFHQY